MGGGVWGGLCVVIEVICCTLHVAVSGNSECIDYYFTIAYISHQTNCIVFIAI